MYEHEERIFRLIHMQTIRNNNEKLQDLSYFYDPVGNIISIHDDAQQTIFFSGQVVNPYVNSFHFPLVLSTHWYI
jgi:hypothetical protein